MGNIIWAGNLREYGLIKKKNRRKSAVNKSIDIN